MDKQGINHNKLLAKVVSTLKANGIDNNSENKIHYSRLLKDDDCCHFVLHGLTTYPLKVKTAYAESKSSNQAEGYIIKIHRMKDEVIFIYDGDGWKKQSYLWALYDIGNAIGANRIFNLNAFDEWLKVKLEEKESH